MRNSAQPAGPGVPTTRAQRLTRARAHLRALAFAALETEEVALHELVALVRLAPAAEAEPLLKRKIAQERRVEHCRAEATRAEQQWQRSCEGGEVSSR